MKSNDASTFSSFKSLRGSFLILFTKATLESQTTNSIARNVIKFESICWCASSVLVFTFFHFVASHSSKRFELFPEKVSLYTKKVLKNNSPPIQIRLTDSCSLDVPLTIEIK